MILLKLFTEFLKVGTFSIGAYTGIPLTQEIVLRNAWIDKAMFANMLAISESTPGPILVNAATYIGSVKAGFLGSVVATFGVILPAFLVIVFICMLFKNWSESKPVQAILRGVKPCAIGIIFATGANMLLASLLPDNTLDKTGILILLILLACAIFYHHRTKKFLSPIKLIIYSAVLGILLY